MLQHTLAKIDGTDLTVSSIVKTVDVLMAIRWIKQAWEEVKPQTIAKCFRQCGAIPQEQSDEDPFAGLDDEDDATARLEELVDQLGSDITTDEYMAADDDLCTCLSFDDPDKWREELRDMVCDDMESSAKIPAAVQDNDNDSDDKEEPEVERSTIHTYDEALKVTNELMLFFAQQGEEELSDVMFKAVVDLQAIKLKKSMELKQSNILQFLK